MQIIFTRHGETNTNVDKVIAGHMQAVLTEKGIAQAKKLGEQLRDFRITAAYVSPLVRAQDTFTNAFPNPNFPVYTEELVIERNFGPLEGKKNSQEDPYYGAWQVSRQSEMNGEKIADVADRWGRFIEKIKSEYSDESTILVVAHGGLGCVARAYFEGLPDNGDYLSVPPIPNGGYAIWNI